MNIVSSSDCKKRSLCVMTLSCSPANENNILEIPTNIFYFSSLADVTLVNPNILVNNLFLIHFLFKTRLWLFFCCEEIWFVCDVFPKCVYPVARFPMFLWCLGEATHSKLLFNPKQLLRLFGWTAVVYLDGFQTMVFLQYSNLLR